MTELPRLLNEKLEEVSRLHPVGLSITETLVPLSFATMHLLKDEMIDARRWVELFTPIGSAGIFRTRSPQTGIGSEDYTIELEHGIVELGDYIIPASIEGEMTCRKALQSIFEHYRGQKWKLGKVECTDKVVVDIDHDNLLQAVNDVLSQCTDYVMKFNFRTSPWTLTIVKKESTVTAEGRLSRNVKSATIKSNDEDLCTRIWIMGLDEKNKERYTYVNADTISDYGLVEHVDFGSGYTKEQAELVVKQYLEAHKKPRVSVEISAVELSQITGEELDKFRPGKFFRLAIPSRNVIIEDVITSVTWSDVYLEPLKATVSLGDNRDSVLTFYQKQQSASKAAKKSGVKKSKEFQTYIRQTDSTIELHARRMGASESILKQAGLYLDSNGLLLYADDNENNVGSKIKQNADSISLVVEGTGKNAKIKPASIVASINGSKSEVMISADKIKLDGNVDLNSVLYVGSGTAKFRKPAYFEGADRDVSINNGKVVAGGGVQIGANRNLVFLEGAGESQAIVTITPTVAGNLIKSAEVSGNSLILTNVKGDTVNFSKAVTLKGEWKQKNNTTIFEVTSTSGAISGTAPSATISLQSNVSETSPIRISPQFPTMVWIPIKVMSNVSGSESPIDTGYSNDPLVNLASVLQTKNNVTVNGAVPLGEGYVGFGSVTVNVTTGLNGSWTDGLFSVSASKSGIITGTLPSAMIAAVENNGKATKITDLEGVSVPVKVTSYVNGGETPKNTGFSGTLNVALSSLLQDKNATSNGTVSPGDQYLGLRSVNVNVTTGLTGKWNNGLFSISASKSGVISGTMPSARIAAVEGGTPTKISGMSGISVPVTVKSNVSGAESPVNTGYSGTLNVALTSLLQTKTATSNGTITPDSGYLGLSSVTVNVAHSINIPPAQIYTSGSSRGTKLDTLKTRYEQAKADSDYVMFRVDCGGESKWFYMEP